MNERAHVTEAVGDRSIQASYDELDGDPAYLIADVTSDDAWLSISAGDEIEVGKNR